MSQFISDSIKLHLQEELLPAPNKGFYICPLCGSGTGKGHGKPDGALHLTPSGTKWHCFSCGKGGDILDLLVMRDGYDNATARQILIERYGETTVNNKFLLKSKTFAKQSTISDKNDRYINFVNRSASLIKGSEGERYLLNRGFTQETISKFNLGYDPKNKTIVIPYPNSNYYTTRTIYGERRYYKIKGKEEPLFILTENNDSDTLFICEGQLDAISLYQAGANSIISIGGSGYNRLKDLHYANIIIIKDNDQAGTTIANQISNIISSDRKKNIISVNPPSNINGNTIKDVNDVLKIDSNYLTKLIIEWSNQISIKENADNVTIYLNNIWDKDIAKFSKLKDKKTGYSNIDDVTSLYPGLYVVGAISSLGKTTFIHQLGDQLARRNESVIYFSLEQSRMELVSKGISRLMAQYNINTAISAIDIRRGAINQSILQAIQEYKVFTDREYIVECNFDTNVDFIINYVNNHINKFQHIPVVIIDYLQIIKPLEAHQNTKDAVDVNVRALKKLQSDNNLVLFVISSLNRQNYLTPVDFESFKESGGIEYTADVIWGLQLQIMNSDIFSSDKKLKDKREAVRKAKLESPRKIELMCLKNRYGISSYSCLFDYYPQFDYFVPVSDNTSHQAYNGSSLNNEILLS